MISDWSHNIHVFVLVIIRQVPTIGLIFSGPNADPLSETHSAPQVHEYDNDAKKVPIFEERRIPHLVRSNRRFGGLRTVIISTLSHSAQKHMPKNEAEIIRASRKDIGQNRPKRIEYYDHHGTHKISYTKKTITVDAA